MIIELGQEAVTEKGGCMGQGKGLSGKNQMKFSSLQGS